MFLLLASLMISSLCRLIRRRRRHRPRHCLRSGCLAIAVSFPNPLCLSRPRLSPSVSSFTARVQRTAASHEDEVPRGRHMLRDVAEHDEEWT